MSPDEYGICMTGGYAIGRQSGGYEVDAIVYIWGGRNVARFSTAVSGTLTRERATELMRERAEAWIAADDATRRQMNRAESYTRNGRTKWWRKLGIVA